MHRKRIAFLALLWSCNSYAAKVNKLILIRADTGKVIEGFNPINNGATIDLSKLPTQSLSVRATTDTKTRSVRFTLDGTYSYVDNIKPFTLCEPGPNCPKWVEGAHTLTAQPFSRANARGTAGAVFKRSFNVIAGTTPLPPPPPPPPAPPSTCNNDRGLWLWTTRDVLAKTAEQDALIQASLQANITDIHLYLVASDYVDRQSSLQAFIRKLSAAGLRAWGLEGYRGYFSDVYGPSEFYRTIDALIAYNKRVAANERFVGFQGDMEPQDGQGSEFPNTFHNGLADAALSASGGGVWKASAKLDRDFLMQDWLTIYTTASQKLHGAGLKLGAAMPSWTDDYYGEEVHVTVNGSRDSIMKHMMTVVDEYMVMSYNTNPTNASNRVAGELAYGDTLPATNRPKISASVETHKGVGSGISYGDTAGKATRTAVLNDMKIITSLLNPYSSFCGVNIHDWVGWRDLNP